MSAFSELYRAIVRRHRSTLWLSAACAAGVSAAAVSLLGLSGWFLSASAIAGASGPAVAQVFNYLLPSAGIRFLAIARTALRYFERYLGHAAALRALSELRPQLFERLSGGEPAPLLAKSRGEGAGRLAQDVGVLEGALVAQSAPVAALAGLASALLLCLPLGLMTATLAALGMVAAFGLSLMVVRWLAPSQAIPQTHLAQLKQQLYQALPFLPEAPVYDFSRTVEIYLTEQEDALEAAHGRQIGVESVVRAVTLVVMAITLVLIVAVNQNAGLPLVALSVLAISLGFDSLGPLLQRFANTARFVASESRLAELVDLPAATPPEVMEAGQLAYRGQRFDLNAQTRLRLSGPTGAGKTRLIEALMDLRPLSDVPGLEATTQASRRLFSLAPQDAAVINGTVRDNLMMAASGRALTEGDLWAVLETACLKDRIMALPQKLDSWVGEGGLALSGGERKRLGIARALLRSAPILILDEPTEGLDARTETSVIDAIDAHLTREGRGLILISHRPAPLRLSRETCEIV